MRTTAIHPFKARATEYPESDGEPMAETDVHRKLMIDLLTSLDEFFRDDPNVYVAGNLFVYYEEGNPSAVVAPDVFVVKGVPKGDRRVFKVWEEGKGPDVVIELTSLSTRAEDLGAKKGTYEFLGVCEYFIFDPLAEHLRPVLRGYRLADSGYQPMIGDRLTSRVLELELRAEGTQLRFYNPATGCYLRTPAELAEAYRAAEARTVREAEIRRAAESRAAYEAEARRAAEAEVERLQAELARLRGS